MHGSNFHTPYFLWLTFSLSPSRTFLQQTLNFIHSMSFKCELITKSTVNIQEIHYFNVSSDLTTFSGQDEVVIFHCNDRTLVSGSFPYTQVSLPVIIYFTEFESIDLLDFVVPNTLQRDDPYGQLLPFLVLILGSVTTERLVAIYVPTSLAISLPVNCRLFLTFFSNNINRIICS
jgi:hypothetical protein